MIRRCGGLPDWPPCAHFDNAQRWCKLWDCKTTWDSERPCWAVPEQPALTVTVAGVPLCGNCKASVMPAATHCHMCGKMYGRLP